VNRRLHVLHLAIGALSIGLVFWWLQFSTPSICCGDFDGYYHIKWSQLLWQGLRSGHFPPAFTWLPLTTLSASRYADQHFLFHVLLIPFTWLGDLRVGAKVAAVLFGSAAVFSVYWLVLRYRIRYPLLWLLALLGCSWLFYARLNMTKAQSISILFMVAGIYLLFERKYTWLALAAFLYVWTYNLFVMLGVLVLIWFAVVWWTELRIEWRPLLWTGLGMLAGFIVNPYFPRNVSLFLEHLVAKSGPLMPAGVGFEWYSLTSWTFLSSSVVACAAMAIGYIAFGYALSINRPDKVRMQRPLLFLIFSTCLLLITARSNRFMEYWPPFAVLFAAFTLQAVWESSFAGENSQPVTAELKKAKRPKHKADEATASALYIGMVVILLVAALVYNLHTTRAKITTITTDPEHYRAGAEWLRSNVPPGSLIYDVNWSDFPKLFFYDTDHSYVSGLDAIYLQDQHPELALLNKRLSSGEEGDPAGAIQSLFAASNPGGVSYLFVGDDPNPPAPEWFRYMRKTGRFKSVYADKECVILQVLDNPESTASAAPVPQQKSQWDTPEQRKTAAAEVHRRFGGEIYGTADENFEGAPALVVHNKHATEDWAKKLFEQDMASIRGEALWQLGFRKYVVTNEAHGWVAAVEGNEKFRTQFNEGPEPQK
jgi:hypothetical protein